jgi:fatty acid desaturase
MSNSTVQQERILELLEKYGRNLHSFMVLEPGLSVWLAEDAAIAYAQRGGYWVAVGGPLCSPDQTVSVANAFREAASEVGCGVVFFGVTQPLVDRLEGTAFDALRIGVAPIWNPVQWDEAIRKAEKLRNRLSKAHRCGITVRLLNVDEVADHAPLRAQLTKIVDQWADQKALPPMGFMATVELFQHSDRRRYFIVQCGDVVYGFAACVPIYGRNGWLVEDMMIRPGSPAGCGEALVDAVMRQLSAQGGELVSLGMVALAGLDAGEQLGRHPFLTGLLRFCGKTMGWLYNFDGLYRFRNKMKPSAWEPVYLISSGPVTFLTVRAILMAFAEGWVPRFGVRVLGRWVRKWSKRTSADHEDARRKKRIDTPIALLAFVSMLATTLAVLGVYQNWLPWWLAIGIGTLGTFAGFTPVHEAVHGNVSSVKFINAATGHLCSVLLNGAFRPYCFLHRTHHLHTNQPSEDPDYWCGLGPRYSIPLRWLTQDIGYLKFYLSRWSSRPILERADLLLCTSLYIGLAVGSLLFNPELFFAFAVGWFIPARLALFALAATFSWLPHQPHSATDPYHATTVHSSPWLTWFLLGQNFHLVHHLDPSIPFYKLSNKWESAKDDYLSHGAIDKSSSCSSA